MGRTFDKDNPFIELKSGHMESVEELAKIKQKQDEDKATARLHSINANIIEGTISAVEKVEKMRFLSKFEKKAVRCVFTGYDTERKGWRCVDPVTGRIHVSRNVVFDDASSWWSSDHTTLPDSRELVTELQRKMNSDVMLEPVSEELVEPSVEETSN
ncbi:hypothetical protein MRB53_015515 [Persea americana]|uniref:Uncharacterized protein n=1 Tax=Persea americana TaxID=3435 RepID=A0ACC2LZL4_PERAE|nr:hypothetical protein MRB53_015515 [Persea americana]